MAKFIDISLVGDAKLQADLKALPIAIQRKLIRKGMRTAGNIELKAAKEAAMSFSKGAEGRLDEPFMPKIAKGLKLRALKRSRKGFGVRIVTPTREELGLAPTRKGYPPTHIEFGTGASKKGGTKVMRPALPYMRRSFDMNEQRMYDAIAEDVREGIAQFNAGGMPS